LEPPSLAPVIDLHGDVPRRGEHSVDDFGLLGDGRGQCHAEDAGEHIAATKITRSVS
jgi:hypothetical protein